MEVNKLGKQYFFFNSNKSSISIFILSKGQRKDIYDIPQEYIIKCNCGVKSS